MIKLLSKKRGIDLLSGSVFYALVVYSIPLIITNVVQLLFHATDVAVLGIMAGDKEVAAVGACGSLISLLVSLFNGLASGANVLMAKRVGASDREGARRVVGVSILVALLSGLILMAVALFGARGLLVMMNCQKEVLDSAVLYLSIYFMGMPILMLYNFVAGLLRSVGDSSRPMFYMLISGALNIVLNVVFIGFFKMKVEGVAIATVLSNLAALILAMVALAKNKDFCRIEKKNIRIRKFELLEIVRVGVPTSMCGIFFYVANVIIASAVNYMGTDTMTANAISSQFDGVIYQVGCSIAISCMVMVGQCVGARNYVRIKQTMRVGCAYATAVSLCLGALFAIFSEPLLSIMTDSSSIVEIAKGRMYLLCFTYFLTSIMEVFSFSLRSMGKATVTMIVGAITGLGMRSLWVYFIWPLNESLWFLYLAFVPSALCAILIYFFVYRKTVKDGFEIKA